MMKSNHGKRRKKQMQSKMTVIDEEEINSSKIMKFSVTRVKERNYGFSMKRHGIWNTEKTVSSLCVCVKRLNVLDSMDFFSIL